MSTRWVHWLTDLPTRFHLWSAELELRWSDPGSTPARRANLDRLRRYRRDRHFPRNGRRAAPTPCFVDLDGRRCAVAHLMHESGRDIEVRKITETANFARVMRMNPVLLDDWAASSGLTKQELARIQPTYPGGGAMPADSMTTLDMLWLVVTILVPIGLTTIVANALRLTRAWVRLTWVTAGAVLGVTLIALAGVLHYLERVESAQTLATTCGGEASAWLASYCAAERREMWVVPVCSA